MFKFVGGLALGVLVGMYLSTTLLAHQIGLLFAWMSLVTML